MQKTYTESHGKMVFEGLGKIAFNAKLLVRHKRNDLYFVANPANMTSRCSWALPVKCKDMVSVFSKSFQALCFFSLLICTVIFSTARIIFYTVILCLPLYYMIWDHFRISQLLLLFYYCLCSLPFSSFVTSALSTSLLSVLFYVCLFSNLSFTLFLLLHSLFHRSTSPITRSAIFLLHPFVSLFHSTISLHRPFLFIWFPSPFICYLTFPFPFFTLPHFFSTSSFLSLPPSPCLPLWKKVITPDAARRCSVSQGYLVPLLLSL